MRMYRTPEWKLVRDCLNPERSELYHLKGYPAETRNLIDDKSESVERIRSTLDKNFIQAMRAINAPSLPEDQKRQ